MRLGFGRQDLAEHLLETQEPSAKQWLFRMLDILSHHKFVKLAVTLWAVWTVRRKAIHEEIFQSPLTTHLFVERFISELECTKVITETTRSGRNAPTAMPSTAWKPPPPVM